MKKYFLLCLCTINIGMYAQVAGTPYLMASQQVNVEVLVVGAGGGGGGAAERGDMRGGADGEREAGAEAGGGCGGEAGACTV